MTSAAAMHTKLQSSFYVRFTPRELPMLLYRREKKKEKDEDEDEN